MELDGGTGWESSPHISAAPFCRADELQDIFAVLHARECRAVFLTSDRGLGASTILREVVAQARNNVPVVLIHGSTSLSSVPFGVLAQYTAPAHSGHPSIKMSVLHALLVELELLRNQLPEAASTPRDAALIVIDNAHFLDAATADLLVDLVMSGTVSIVASHWSRRDLPAPLPKLWSAGMAENIILAPLTLNQVQDFCELTVGGPLQQATIRYFCWASAGNPQLLHLMLADAANNGQLRKQRGRWFIAQNPTAHGRVLQETVTLWLGGLSEDGLAALRLLALAEPVAEAVLRAMFGPTAVLELYEWQLVQPGQGGTGQLSLVNPLYGDVIRDSVPIGQSRKLYEQFSQFGGAGTVDGAALLRRVTWALALDVTVPQDLMLRAAIFASQVHESTTALHVANAIQGEQYRISAEVVKARAKFNLGDYQGAFEHLEIMPDEAGNLEDLLCGSLLRSSIRLALGMPGQALEDDAEALRKDGERLALAHPEQAEHIREHSRKSALLVTLMKLSMNGRYLDMLPPSMVLAQTPSPATGPADLFRAFALAMDAERLTAQGYPLQAGVRAEEASALQHMANNDVFFLREFITLRQGLAAVSAGEWKTAAAILEKFAQDSGAVLHSFASMANVLDGMVFLRCGAQTEALDTLLTALDALTMGDPLQLRGFATAMAAYAAATLGRSGLAEELLQEHVAGPGMFVVVAYERAYLSAARHRLMPDAGGLTELVAQADSACAEESTMLELHALAMMLELGDESTAVRVQEAAQCVEGPWARAIGAYARALQPRNAPALNLAAETLTGVGLLGLARQARHKAAGQRHSKTLSGGAALKTSSYQHLANPAGTAETAGAEGPEGQVRLTRREHEVTRLAAAGMSDRDIAQTLKVALRTVEGHLYRAYGKLGVSTREELPLALSRQISNP